uniref:Uncharacterized protein n=1 Tax=Rhizophora mucronata TaxID=61149 RepID=A0A2P2Q8S3_RHIMU
MKSRFPFWLYACYKSRGFWCSHQNDKSFSKSLRYE